MKPKPILFIFGGLTCYSQSPYVLNVVINGVKRGYDIAMVNHRGLAQAGLVTTKMYSFWSHHDTREAIEFILNKYYTLNNRPKVFAVGCSLGGSNLVNMLGFDGQRVNERKQLKSLVDGAFLLSTPMKLWECYPNF